MLYIINILFLAVGLFLAGCSNPEFIIQRKTFNCESPANSNGKMVSGNAHSGNSFVRLDGPMNFGPGYDCAIPEIYVGKELRVVMTGWLRSNYAQSNVAIVISTYDEEKRLSWQTVPLRNFVKDINKWSLFTDSLLIPASFDGRKYKSISIYTLLGDSKGEVADFDDVEITLKYRDKF